MSFPWIARVNTRTYRKCDRWLSIRRSRKTLGWFVAMALGGLAQSLLGHSANAAPLDGMVPGGGSWTGANNPVPNLATRTLTIEQTQSKAVLNWSSLNVRAGEHLRFEQQAPSWIVLNHIHDLSPSKINGEITAQGQVYLVNQNGILFGSGAQVNTHSFVASTINIDEQVFNSGMADAINQSKAAFDSGAINSATGYVRIDAGAVLKSGEGGNIVIVAPAIENHGEINTPGGQAILAASHDKVYLVNPTDPNTRGLLVEVATGGDVTNLGRIIAERGDVSIIGHAVNQSGLVRATTAVNLNGTIHLLARDGATPDINPSTQIGSATAHRTGDLTLGAGSLTEIAADHPAQTATDIENQPRSQVALMGNQVTMQSGARIVAPAGNVLVTATHDASTTANYATNTSSNSQFLMESGSSIDVAGLNSAVLPMERNSVAVELRGSQLADSPLQRSGPLYGKTVYVDARQGTPLANVSADLAKIDRPLDERLAVGGKVTIASEKDVVMQKNSTINVAGGSIRYQDGFVTTTQLVSQGKVYDIGGADPNRPYDGIFGSYQRVHRKWNVTEDFNIFGGQQYARFESGYVEGKDAGTVAINARSMELQGALQGGVTAGRYQRLPQAGLSGAQRTYTQLPLGGELVLGTANNPGLNSFTLTSLADLGAKGINRLQVYARDSIDLPGGTDFVLGTGGTLALTASHVDVQGGIVAHGGEVSITGLGGATTPLSDGSAVRLGETGKIDVSGQWVNDSPVLNPEAAPQDPVFINGGKVSITASGDIALASGSLIDADGGARLQRNGTLQYGQGGDIAIKQDPLTGSRSTKPLTLRLDGDLQAYSFGTGGTLALTGAGFRIGGPQSEVPPDTLHLDPAFFQRGGFRAYDLTSRHTGISIAQNTDVVLRPMNRLPGPTFNAQATGTDLNRLGSPGVLPGFQQQPVSLALTLKRADDVADTAQVVLESGSSIHANPGANVTLTSDTNLIVDGTIAAPAGNIQLHLTKPGFIPASGNAAQSQAIRLGPHGQLLAGAVYQPVIDGSGRGLRLGTVRDGGTISVAAGGDAAAGADATVGYFIASPGSRMDVSGTTQTLDVAQGLRITPTAVNGAAGTIDLTASEGMALNGRMTGAAGAGPGAAGGTLSIALGTATSTNTTIALTTDPTVVAPGPGDTNLGILKGQVEVSSAQVRDGGFDSLVLHSRGTNSDTAAAPKINLVGDVDLTLKGRLVLDAPLMASQGGHAKLAGSSLVLGPETTFNPVDISLGQGSVLFGGKHVDIRGQLSLSGFGPGAGGSPPVQILSDGDIRLIGGEVKTVTGGANYATGGLHSLTDLTLRADQVYTASATDYAVSAPGSTLRIQPGRVSQAPLSAGSRLTLDAENIEQSGTLRAPFGQIVLDAKNNLVMAPGSLTSVSGAGQLVPFGKTELGQQDWVYPIGAVQNVLSAAPEKRVSMTAPQVTLAPSAVVDVAGGGDLLAREQLPGPGGSIDILDAAHANGAFAIVPTRTDLYGSYDPFLSAGSPVKPGDTITIAAGGPMAAGQYAILPAGYALLPGAYLVTPLVKTTAPVPGQAIQQSSGASIVAGQRSDAGTGAHASLWSAFLVESGTQVRSRAEYLESRTDTLFAPTGARLNQDAGRLVINAGTALTLGGTLASNAAGGNGAEVDILATKLAVVHDLTGAGDTVELLDTGLNQLHADSLLLGGTRAHQGADLSLDVQATDVTVDSGASLTAAEVMLAANHQVRVADGASITAAGRGRVGTSGSIRISGDGALARVSSGEQVRVQRIASPGNQGTLDIAAGAKLDAARSLTLDASLDTKVAGALETHDGSLSLAASRISLGDAPAASGGLVLSNDRLKNVHASELILNSRSTIDLYGSIALNLNRVALDAAGVYGYGGTGQDVSFAANNTIALSNRSGYLYPDTVSPVGGGTLTLAAPEVTLGAGDFSIRGFRNTTLAAADRISARPETDTAVKLHVAGDLVLQTPLITASEGADVRIDTQDATGAMTGKMLLTAPTTSDATVADLGAKLDLAATRVDVDTRIALPSGSVNVRATGAGGVHLAGNAAIDVAGRDVTFADFVGGSPGGSVSLTADQGDVVVGPQARIDISGAPGGGDAGELSIRAPAGSAQVDPAARVAASARSGGRGGSFALDAGTLAGGFSPLNATLNAAGFTDARQLRLRDGNVTIDRNDTVLAHDLRIAADAGSIDVLGHIDASGTQAGQVALYARDDVRLHATSRVDAQATGAGGQGGSVTLGSGAGPAGASTPGRVDVQAGAQINVAGKDSAGAPTDTGSVHLRAPRVGTNGVAINPIDPATITGAKRVDMEAYAIDKATTIDNGLMATVTNNANAYMAGADAIKSGLGVGNDTRFHLLAGVEIDSASDLTLGSSWDLLGWRPGGEAGVLTLKAAGDLNINQSLSDGVATVPDALDGTTLRTTAATMAGAAATGNWSYRLTAGADLTGADPLAVSPGAGSVRLAAGAKVRSGTGNIDIAAGQDLVLADKTAAIYTVGENRGAGVFPGTDLPADLLQELVLSGDFLQKGGSITISAAGDILGANSHQLINEWLPRIGGNINLPDNSSIHPPGAWAVNIDNFQQNVGALGGGNVTVNAGGNVDDLSVVIPTTGQPVGGSGTAPAIAGGGDLRISAGGHIGGGVFYLGKGTGYLQAGDSITHAQNAKGQDLVYPVLALGDGQYTLRARKDVSIESIVNPTVLPMSATQGRIDYLLQPTPTFFFTYTQDSAARLEALSGNVSLRGDTTALQNFNLLSGAAGTAALGTFDVNELSYLPGTLSARSLQGDVTIGSSITLTPAPRGDLELLAGGSILPGTSSTTLSLSDADPARLPGILAPAAGLPDVFSSLDPQGTNAHAATPVHLGDTRPVRIVAQTGDIGTPQGSNNQLSLAFSKQARLYAGVDVRNLPLNIQHVNTADISVVQAGGSVLFPASRDTRGFLTTFESNTKIFRIAGPGQFYAISGKDVDLGISNGIQTIGNQNNKALPDGGASITVMTGQAQAPNYRAFIDHYLVKQDTYNKQLTQYMSDLGVGAPAGGGTLVDSFLALPLLQQRQLILGIFFNELRESGIAAAKSQGGPDYRRGFTAIQTLFPSGPYPGDLKSYLSQIYTRQGGDINLVVPGGFINAGVASTTGISKPADQLGIAALGPGNVNAFVQGDFLVNSSRVYALDGGDVLMWSSLGDIDAGKGAKTALSIPSPVASHDPDGNTFLEFPPAVSGSGIRADVHTPGRTPGDVYLIAPQGVVNAGDAGIGSAGNLTIAAVAVHGADNIKVGGTSIGVPTDGGGLGAGLAGVGDIAAATSKVAEDATRGLGAQQNDNPPFLGVEVIGFGE